MTDKMFKKVLIANRGEIACRIMRTCRALGMRSAAVYSAAEGMPLHAETADEAHPLPERATPAGAYLDADAIADIAANAGADAVHPGYGFLSESPELAERCAARGIAFVGPNPDAARLMADKWAAREKMSSLGALALPGAALDADDLSAATDAAAAIGYPIMVKSTDGGGGIGMQIVESAERLESAAQRASSSAQRFFGSARVYLEKYLPDARHIEVQILADEHGHAQHLWERECSAQRRHQKVIEEAPSPSVSDDARLALARQSEDAARATSYTGAGTFEYLVDDAGNAYFLEANTRLQVEHPVTEMITGVDIVEQQFRAAAGLSLSLPPAAPRRGHAVECRIYAEHPKTFMPSPGTLQAFALPSMPNLRIDAGYRGGDEVTPYFDPMLAKFAAWGEDRAAAIALMQDALAAADIAGVDTNIPLLQAALAHPDFAAGRYDTGLLEKVTL